MEEILKRKGVKVFGSFERGLDKVIIVFIRSKRKGFVRDGFRRLKFYYNVIIIRLVNLD